eukprot:CAMPEP_0198260618 /NCGR_PEP_ID=MMETSP1447-20131203/9541_1 /TAXON_ID=420782 /ORGANISM="Chaetoceros dichaeta, Strain CCMP1751" /LENGTH=387 /DNA_ID=CAMNT_0043948325 /DNA_START=168 /DNA_END=1328 /DNA_ORIENTATION=+
MSVSLDWQKAWAIAPKFTGGISVLSSLALVYIILRNPRKKNKNKSYHRIILGISICDVLASTAWFFSTWPKPQGTDGVYGAIGTEATCSLQGFFAQFSISTIFYNGVLSIYYLLILDQKWSKKRFYKIEPFLHMISLTWGISTSIAGVALELFNPSGWSCWISRQPSDCISSWKRGQAEPNCYRGNNAEYFVWIFFYAPLWIIIISITFCMTRVYWTVSQEEKQYIASITEGQVEFNEVQDEPKPKKNSRRLANRAGLYVGAFYLTWIMPTILELISLSSSKIFPTLIFLAAILIPTQGLFNLVIYTLPAFAKFRKQDYLQNQLLVVVWFKMLAVELGLIKVDEDQPKEDTCNDESNNETVQRNGETILNNDESIARPVVTKTLSEW